MKVQAHNLINGRNRLNLGWHRFTTVAGFASLLVLTMTCVHAQSYRMEKAAIKSGGGTSRGGDYEVKGSIGLTDKGPALNNNEYAVKGGFLVMLAAVQSPDAPHLNISVTATNTAVVSWTASATDFVLEQSSDAATPEWLSVEILPVADGPNRRVILPITPGNKFFRLRKP